MSGIMLKFANYEHPLLGPDTDEGRANFFKHLLDQVVQYTDENGFLDFLAMKNDFKQMYAATINAPEITEGIKNIMRQFDGPLPREFVKVHNNAEQMIPTYLVHYRNYQTQLKQKLYPNALENLNRSLQYLPEDEDAPAYTSTLLLWFRVDLLILEKKYLLAIYELENMSVEHMSSEFLQFHYRRLAALHLWNKDKKKAHDIYLKLLVLFREGSNTYKFILQLLRQTSFRTNIDNADHLAYADENSAIYKEILAFVGDSPINVDNNPVNVGDNPAYVDDNPAYDDDNSANDDNLANVEENPANNDNPIYIDDNPAYDNDDDDDDALVVNDDEFVVDGDEWVIGDDEFVVDGDEMVVNDDEVVIGDDELVVDDDYSGPFLHHEVQITQGNKGPFVKATNNIDIGQLILDESPLAFYAKSNTAHMLCSFCYKRSVAPHFCASCVNVGYCSVECRDKAKSGHLRECKLYGVMKDSNLSIDCFIALKLITQIDMGLLQKIYNHNSNIFQFDTKRVIGAKYKALTKVCEAKAKKSKHQDKTIDLEKQSMTMQISEDKEYIFEVESQPKIIQVSNQNSETDIPKVHPLDKATNQPTLNQISGEGANPDTPAEVPEVEKINEPNSMNNNDKDEKQKQIEEAANQSTNEVPNTSIPQTKLPSKREIIDLFDYFTQQWIIKNDFSYVSVPTLEDFRAKRSVDGSVETNIGVYVESYLLGMTGAPITSLVIMSKDDYELLPLYMIMESLIKAYCIYINKETGLIEGSSSRICYFYARNNELLKKPPLRPIDYLVVISSIEKIILEQPEWLKSLIKEIYDEHYRSTCKKIDRGVMTDPIPPCACASISTIESNNEINATTEITPPLMTESTPELINIPKTLTRNPENIENTNDVEGNTSQGKINDPIPSISTNKSENINLNSQTTEIMEEAISKIIVEYPTLSTITIPVNKTVMGVNENIGSNTTIGYPKPSEPGNSVAKSLKEVNEDIITKIKIEYPTLIIKAIKPEQEPKLFKLNKKPDTIVAKPTNQKYKHLYDKVNVDYLEPSTSSMSNTNNTVTQANLKEDTNVPKPKSSSKNDNLALRLFNKMVEDLKKPDDDIAEPSSINNENVIAGPSNQINLDIEAGEQITNPRTLQKYSDLYTFGEHKLSSNAKDFVKMFAVGVFVREHFIGPLQNNENKKDDMILKMFIHNLSIVRKFIRPIVCATVNPLYRNMGLDTIGFGIYTCAGSFTHDCYPNVTRHYENGRIVLRTIRQIQGGEKLTDSFMGHFLDQPREERWRFMRGYYNMICNCEACLEDWPTYSAMIADRYHHRVLLRCPQPGCPRKYLFPGNSFPNVCSTCRSVKDLPTLQRNRKTILKMKNKTIKSKMTARRELNVEKGIACLEEEINKAHKIAAPPQFQLHKAEKMLNLLYSVRCLPELDSSFSLDIDE